MNNDKFKKVPLESVMSIGQFIMLTGISRQNFNNNYILKDRVDFYCFTSNEEKSRDVMLLICNQRLLDLITYFEMEKKRRIGNHEHGVAMRENALKQFKFINLTDKK